MEQELLKDRQFLKNKLENLLDINNNNEFLETIVDLFSFISNDYKTKSGNSGTMNILQHSSNEVIYELMNLYKKKNSKKKIKYSDIAKNSINKEFDNKVEGEEKKNNINKSESLSISYNKNELSYPKDIIILSYIQLKSSENENKKNIISIKGFMHINSLDKFDDKSFFVTQENECVLPNDGEICKLINEKINKYNIKPLNLDKINKIVGYKGLYNVEKMWIIPFTDFPFNEYSYKNKGQRFMPLINNNNEECSLFINKFKNSKIYMKYNTSITPGIITNLVEKRSKDNKVVKLYKLLIRYSFINKYKKTLNYRNTSLFVSPHIIKTYKLGSGQLCLTTNIKCHNFCSSILLTLPINLCQYISGIKQNIYNNDELGMNIKEDILKQYNIKNWLLQYNDIFNKLERDSYKIDKDKLVIKYNEDLLSFNINEIKKYIKSNDTKKLYNQINYDNISNEYLLDEIKFYISSINYNDDKKYEKSNNGLNFYTDNKIFMLTCIN